MVADDDEDMRALVVATLQAAGCRTREACDGAELLELLDGGLDDAADPPDVLVTDVKMPRLSGLGVLDALRRAHLDLPVVMMTVVNDEFIDSVALRLGAVGVLRKPFDPEILVTAVRNARTVCERRRTRRALRE